MKYKTYILQEIATFTTGKLNSNEAERNGKYPFLLLLHKHFESINMLLIKMQCC